MPNPCSVAGCGCSDFLDVPQGSSICANFKASPLGNDCCCHTRADHGLTSGEDNNTPKTTAKKEKPKTAS